MEEMTKAEQIQEILEGLQDTILQAHLIQDNKYIFAFNGVTYRIRMPSQKEKCDADNVKNGLYLQLIKEGTNYTRKQLTQLLKEKQDIDIQVMEEKKDALRKELETLYYDLAGTLTSNPEGISLFEDKIKKVKVDFQKVAIEISTYLMPCIEDRLEKIYVEFLTFKCAEKAVDEKWEKVWTKLEDYQNEASGLEDRSAEGMIALLMNVHQ